MTVFDRTTRPPRRRPAGGGFTLMEMVVVVGLVALMAALSLPSIIALFNAGADAQAYNLIAAQLTAARALAIEKGTYAGVHCQLADAETGSRLLRPELRDVCFTAIVLYNPRRKYFNVYGQLRRVPGSYAFGQLTSETVQRNSSEYSSDAGKKEEFTTFTVVFTAQGAATTSVQGRPIYFNPNHAVFSDAGVDPNSAIFTGTQRLWDCNRANYVEGSSTSPRYGVLALTMFDMGEYVGRKSDSERTQYLSKSGQFLPLNMHTGQLYPRE